MDNMEPMIDGPYEEKPSYCIKHVVCRGQPRCLPWYRRWWGWVDETLWIWRLALKKRLGL